MDSSNYSGDQEMISHGPPCTLASLVPIVFLAPDFQGSGQMTRPSFLSPTEQEG